MPHDRVRLVAVCVEPAARRTERIAKFGEALRVVREIPAARKLREIDLLLGVVELRRGERRAVSRRRARAVDARDESAAGVRVRLRGTVVVLRGDESVAGVVGVASRAEGDGRRIRETCRLVERVSVVEVALFVGERREWRQAVLARRARQDAAGNRIRIGRGDAVRIGLRDDFAAQEVRHDRRLRVVAHDGRDGVSGILHRRVRRCGADGRFRDGRQTVRRGAAHVAPPGAREKRRRAFRDRIARDGAGPLPIVRMDGIARVRRVVQDGRERRDGGKTRERILKILRNGRAIALVEA